MIKWGGWTRVSSVRSLGSSLGSNDPWAPLDGRSNAPVGATVQFPNLLNPYHYVGLSDGRYRWPTNNVWPSGNLVQPPWMVAGIDYPVGINASAKPLKDVSSNTTLGGSLVTNTNTGFSQTLSFASVPSWVQVGMFVQDVDDPTVDPAQFDFPAGTVISPGGISGGNITVSNAPNNSIGSGKEISFSHFRGIYPSSTQFIVFLLEDNISMDGWDFSAGGGWGFDSEQNVGVKLRNCKFTYGNNMKSTGIVNINLAHNGIVLNSGGTIEYCELYCNGSTVDLQNAIGIFGGITTAVTTTVQYCYIFQSSGEAISCGETVTSSGSSYIFQYNVIQDCGMGANAFGFHGDVVQTVPASPTTQKSVLKRFNLIYQQADSIVTGAANQGFTTNGLGSTQPNSVLQNDLAQNNTCIVTGNGNMNEFCAVGNPPNTQNNQVTDNYVAPNAYSLNTAGWQFTNKGGPGTINVEHGNVRMDDGSTPT